MDYNELIQLAKDTTIFLSPVLPYLYKAGEEASKEAGKKFGNAVWKKARSLWKILNYNIELRPPAAEAAKDVANNPDDQDAQAALRLQFKKLFKEDHVLTGKIKELLQDKIIQYVLSEQSEIRNVDQEVIGEGAVTQKVIAKDHSKIEGIKQRKQ